MIIELIVMKLTLDAIMQHCTLLAQEQELRDQARRLKARLMKLVSDYETGAIDQKTYAAREAEIMAGLSRLTKQIDDQSGTQSSNTGLGL